MASFNPKFCAIFLRKTPLPTSAFVAIKGQKATIEGKPSAVKVTFKVKKTGKTAKFSYTSKVAVIGEQKPAFGISSVTPEKVNVLKVAFAAPVDITKTTLAVTKDSAAVESKAEFAADGTSATITTTAKMTKGTYTVTVTGLADTALTSGALRF